MKIGETWKHKYTGQEGMIKLIKQKGEDELDHEIYIKWMDGTRKDQGEFIDSGIFMDAFERSGDK